MPAFFDDFDRANGAPGNGWTNTQSTCTISGNALIGNASSAAVNSNTYDTARSEATIHCTSGHTSGFRAGPTVKATTGNTTGFGLTILGTAAPYTLRITSTTKINASAIADYSLDVVLPPMYSLTLIWEAGHLSGYYNGQLLVEGDSGANFSNGLCGVIVYGGGSPVLDFMAVAGEAVALTVDPDVVGNYGTCTELELTGTNTVWTAGTPGSPIFTVDHGTITAQEVIDETHAIITYCPGDFLGDATFTDPSTGATDTIIVTSDPTIIEPPGGLCPFTPEAIAMVNNTAGDSFAELLLKPSSPISVTAQTQLYVETILGRVGLNAGATVDPASLPDPGILWELWRLVNGGYTSVAGPFPEPSFTTVDAGLAALRDLLNGLTDDELLDLQAVIFAIKGADGPNLQELETQIGVAGQGDYLSVIDAVNLTRGRMTVDLAAIYDLLAEYRTDSLYTVQDILDAIGEGGGGGPVDLTPILTKLNLIQPNNAISLSSLSSQLTSLTTTVTNLAASVQAIRTVNDYTIETILDRLDQLRQQISTDLSTLKLPPIWPGLAHVTFGAAADLAVVSSVVGPMHGVVVQITQTEGGTSFMQYDGVKAWRHVGGLTFYDDQGKCETYQALGFGEAMYVPKTMAIAQGVKLFKSHLPRGSITPWTINP